MPHHFARRGFQPCTYILANRKYGTLYVGVTSNLARRAWEHRTGRFPGFTRRYGVKTLVFYEFHGSMLDAIRREKQIKEWKRAWKIELIDSVNAEWCDLFDGVPF